MKLSNIIKEIISRNKTVNADYFQQMLDKSNKLSISQRKYIQDIIDDIRKNNNKATDKQYIIFQRAKSGDWLYSTKN